MTRNFHDFLEDFYYVIKYDVLKFALDKPGNFDQKIFNQRLRIKSLEDGGLIVESIDYPNLYASGKDLEEVRNAFYDTVLTYFDIPRYFAKRMPDKFSFTLADGTEIRAKSYASRYELAGA